MKKGQIKINFDKEFENNLNFRELIVKGQLSYLKHKKRISDEEYEGLNKMLKAQEQDVYLAEEIIKNK